MKVGSKLFAFSLITGAIIAPMSAVVAQSPAAVIEQRKELMKSFFPKYMQQFGKVARGESTDLASIPALAQEASTAMQGIPALFPAGSGPESGQVTRAKPEIWTQRATFEGNAKSLADAVAKLGDVAKTGNIEEFKTAFAAAGRACTACHGGPTRSGGPFRNEAAQ